MLLPSLGDFARYATLFHSVGLALTCDHQRAKGSLSGDNQSGPMALDHLHLS